MSESPELELDAGAMLVRVRNKRGGPFEIPAHVAVYVNEQGQEAKRVPVAKLVFEAGDTVIPLARLNAMSELFMDQVGEWVKAGWLEMLPADAPEPQPEPASPVEPPPASDPVAATLAALDDAAAIELVKAQNSAAMLDAMFAAAGERAAVSEAILARLQELDAP